MVTSRVALTRVEPYAVALMKLPARSAIMTVVAWVLSVSTLQEPTKW